MRRLLAGWLFLTGLGCGGLAGPLYMPPPAPDAATVLSGGRVWTPQGWVDGRVVLDGDRIVCVGVCDVPAGGVEVDVSGLDVAPGLIDLHVHLGVPTRDGAMGVTDLALGRPSMRQAWLERGITSVRPLCDDIGFAQAFMLRLDEEESWAGPRVFPVGPCFTAPNGHPARDLPPHLVAGGVRTPTEPASARRMVRDLRDAGFPGVKVVYDDGGRLGFERMDADVMAAVVDEARQGGQWVAAHIGSNEEVLAVVEAGASTVEHAPREPLSDEAIQAMKDADVTFVPTLAVIEAVGGADWLDVALAATRKAREGGVAIAAGSDTQGANMAFGEGLIRELELLEQAGVPREELLAIATSNAAAALGRDDLGRLEAEARADVVVLERVSWRVRRVWSRGRPVVTAPP